jgi:hypothetical protein
MKHGMGTSLVSRDNKRPGKGDMSASPDAAPMWEISGDRTPREATGGSSPGRGIFLPLILAALFLWTLPAEATLTPVTVMLQWTPQTQFAGIYVAYEKGF